MGTRAQTAHVRNRFEAVLQGIAWNGDQGTARCPVHADHRPSLSVNADAGVFYCHGCKAKGTIVDFERRVLGRHPKPTGQSFLGGAPAKGAATGTVVYQYKDANQKLIFEQIRYKPKTFRSRRPDGRGGWIWNLQGVQRVLYRLPEVLKADKVYIAEGEKDANSVSALTGCAGTTNVGGAGKWRDEYAKSLAGKEIIVLQDGDEPGMKHALEVANSVSKVARSVKLLPPFENAKDVSEWIEKGGTLKKLRKIEDHTPSFTSDCAPRSKSDETATDWRSRPIRGALLVSMLETYFSDYIVLPAGLPLVLSLWVIATYLFNLFDAFPYLSVTSPTKRCGKTRLGELIELICARPQLTVNVSEAALFRLIERDNPTLIIDEAEALSNATSERSQYLRSILQAGFRKGAVVPRCVGKEHQVQNFSVFCPKMLVAIGNLPDTIRDRSVVVMMRRRRSTEEVQRFRRRLMTDMTDGIKNLIQVWTDTNLRQVEKIYSRINLEFLQDREADVWDPLFSVLSIAAPERFEEMRQIALQLSNAKKGLDVDDSLGLRLLTDIRAVFERMGTETLATSELIKELQALPESSWDDLTSIKLARILRPFGVSSRQLWTDRRKNLRGYELGDFQQAFERYL